MKLRKFTLELSLKEHIAALNHLQMKSYPGVDFELSTQAAHIQTVGPGTFYLYILEVSIGDWPNTDVQDVYGALRAAVEASNDTD